MKAAQLFAKGDIRLTEISKPGITDWEILIRTKSSAICGTDIRMFNNGFKNVDEHKPLTLGHEISGIIEQVGENVSDVYKPGMKVAIAPNIGCGTCEMCASGNTHLCPEYKAFGINIPGGFAEFVKIPKEAIFQGNVVLMSESISFEEAALIEPLSCVYNAFERAAIRLGDTVLIIGSGPIGIMHAMMAKQGGASMVIINDLNEGRLKICKETDRSFITLTSENLKENIFKLTGGRGIDVCITANPSPKAQIVALELAAVNGRIIFFGGLPANADISGINTNLIHYKQLIVSGTTRQSAIQYRKTLRLVESGKLDVKKLITHKYKLNQISEAFSNLVEGKGLKHMIVFE